MNEALLKERRLAMKKIKDFHPDLFSELDFVLGGIEGLIPESFIRIANEYICDYCIKKGYPYRELALPQELY